jgi:hypothetical protein
MTSGKWHQSSVAAAEAEKKQAVQYSTQELVSQTVHGVARLSRVVFRPCIGIVRLGAW